MAKRYEGSPKDRAEDARGAKATGMSKKAYEGSARDKREDAKGEHIKVKPHTRKRPGSNPPLAPMPGQNDFDAGQEQAMRQGAAQSRVNTMPDDDDMDGMGGLGGM